jgi:hypothetical protein
MDALLNDKGYAGRYINYCCGIYRLARMFLEIRDVTALLIFRITRQPQMDFQRVGQLLLINPKYGIRSLKNNPSAILIFPEEDSG